ncbi:tetraspanin-5 isoform X4 [Cebus imitator]|uniref:tetraspanin-5 isoform X4 n=1 Tax=Cebus imitator TaxID=2715852 RepID=UPI0018975F8C|nr:tetraspanin-5 isoform X4 [Cebus imitator]
MLAIEGCPSEEKLLSLSPHPWLLPHPASHLPVRSISCLCPRGRTGHDHFGSPFPSGSQSHSSSLRTFLGITFLGIGLWAWNEKFSVFLGIIFFLELTAGVLAFVFKDWIKDQLYFFINNNIRAYRDDIDLQNLIDFTQEYWQCCGAFGADDWNLNIYFNCTDSNASRERCGVPFSCCTKDPAEDVINTQCGYDARQKPEVDQQIVIYTKGCVPQFEKWLQDNLTIVAGIFIGIALLQIFGICLAQNLVSDIEAVRASW